MGVPLALHTSQSVTEFQEMIRRHGKTPIEWLREIGFLGPDVILGHAIVVGRRHLGELRTATTSASWPTPAPTSPTASGSSPAAGSRWRVSPATWRAA